MSETEGLEQTEEWWMALLPAGVKADISYLRQGFIEYFFQKVRNSVDFVRCALGSVRIDGL